MTEVDSIPWTREGAAGTTKTMPMETKTKRRNFDEAFKRDAVTLLLHGGKPLKAMAVDLGYSHWILRDWKRFYGPTAPVPPFRCPLSVRCNLLIIAFYVFAWPDDLLVRFLIRPGALLAASSSCSPSGWLIASPGWRA